MSIKLTKIGLYGIFLNYYCYYVIRGSFIPHGTMIFFALAIFGFVMDVSRSDWNIANNVSVACWAMYGFFAFTTSLIVLDSGMSGLMSDIFKYFQRLMITVMVAHVCNREKSIGFAIRLLAATAIGCAIGVLYSLGDYRLKLDITSGADLSANDVGSIMAYSIFAILYADRGRKGNLIVSGIKMAAIIACMVVVFLAGSRKSIIAILIFAGVFILLCGSEYAKKMSAGQFFTILIIGGITFFVVQKYLLPYATSTNLYDRLFGDNAAGAASSDESRIVLYKQAFQEFIAHPLFGVGFNGFAKLYKNYTHSTYAEPLACSGMIGFLYLYPYYYMLKTQIKMIRANKRRDHKEYLWQKVLFAFLISFLFIGVGIPYIYKDVPCIILGMFIASQHLAYKNLQKL